MSARLSSLLITLLTVAAGGALAGVGAYATNHSADQPALFAALVLATREASKWLDSRDWTRGRNRKVSSAKP